MKLTAAQKKLLKSLQDRCEFFTCGEELPAQLVKLRLAKWSNIRMGRGLLSITRSGLQVLKGGE
ncbi:hypothetical protein LQT97_00805 [Brucella pseudogrignonensis]|uniref:hypothetical protein n=1 Tax=Brucella pseudogrignonensis TaxID=419475 RepID=UPI001E28E800|nr:hypothetical protein [Brucella pseudogrignonensis]MCD4509764.1 hypothetical protein [Brucella pseudogrignonensis]